MASGGFFAAQDSLNPATDTSSLEAADGQAAFQINKQAKSANGISSVASIDVAQDRDLGCKI